MQKLENKVVVITGAGSGVGQATAWRLAEEGVQLVLVGRTEATLQETAARLDPAKTLIYPCDVAKPEMVAGLAETVQRKLGRVEVLVIAAGVNVPRRALAELSLEDYQQIIDINLNGAFLCVQAFLPVMRQQGEGTIINLASVAGFPGGGGSLRYLKIWDAWPEPGN